MSMDLRLLHRHVAGEEVEVATLLGLADMGAEEGAVAALVMRRRRLPSLLAARQLVIGDGEMQLAAGHVELDDVAVAHQGERSADEGFRRYMEDAGAVARAAHPRVRDAHHV